MSPSLAVNSVDPKQASARGGKRVLLYAVAFVSVQALGLVACLVLTSTQWFLKHNGSAGLRMLGYSVRLNNANCDIVLYGDSSALTGLDPQIVQQITGLKTCNLSEGRTIQDVVGMFPLEEYLRHNRRPAYLLAMYTPSLFDPTADPFNRYQVEGLIYGFEYIHSRSFYQALLLHHTRWVLNYALWAGHSLIDNTFRETFHPSPSSPDTREQRRSRDGIWPYPVPVQTDCVRTAKHYSPDEFRRHAEGVDAFRQHYGVDGTRVLVNISPVPDCDVLYEHYARISQGLHDNSFERLPISDYNEGDVHFSAAGSQYISRRAGEQILALMQDPSQAHTRSALQLRSGPPHSLLRAGQR